MTLAMCKFPHFFLNGDVVIWNVRKKFTNYPLPEISDNHDLASMNVCYTNDEMIVCQCNTEFCNKDQPFDVPMGNLLCYYNSNGKPGNIPGMKYCRGERFFFPKRNIKFV